jgi:uncharacterized 2Fe-2S/4Fe-4S cluster protein (DUF4445 family)
MQQIIARTHDGRTVTTAPQEAAAPRTLAQALFLAGLWREVPLCAGQGRCGLCRVRFVSSPPEPRVEELRRLGQERVAGGWRLACLHPAVPCEVEVPASPRAARSGSASGAALDQASEPASGKPLKLAVDLGTTTLHWAATDGARIVAQGGALNPQMGLGSEVMARLAFAATPGGAATLRGLVLDRLREIMAELPGPVDGLAVSGNPAMAALLLGLDTATLAAAPYALPDPCGRECDLGPGLPPAYVPPLFSPFIGADLSAGLAALLFSDSPPKPPFLLADLGTNGEFILDLGPRRLAASVPMGPALEGVGLSCGRTAAPGVITAFRLSPVLPLGLEPIYGAGAAQGAPLGLTGTASLSLCALLLRCGLLSREGHFITAPASPSPLAAKVAAGFTELRGERALALADGVALTASDVEELLKVKAAFNLALSALLEAAGLTHGELGSLHLAGAMGEHVGLDDLERLGFLPPGLAARTIRAGNTSLAGTLLLLTDPQARPRLEALPRPETLDLASAPEFGARYLQRMVFTHVQ